MKRRLNLWLLAALLCGMSMSVTSCKDDDNNSNGTDSEGQETYEGLSTLEDDHLADLIAAWTDTSRDMLNGTSWRNSRYEPTVGLALDESQPGIRYVPVGTIDEADDYAASALGTLGIDYEHPEGFTYSNGQVGTVSYSHVGNGNTLAAITVDIPQIPVLQEIRLIKDLPENASGTPYYKCGDIIKYKNRFYVCVTKHKFGQEAGFITLNDQETHSRGKFTYMGVGKDSVYNDEMAKAEILGDWLENVVCKYDVWHKVRTKMFDTGNDKYARQVVPEDELIRASLIDELVVTARYIPELQEPNPLSDGATMYEISAFGWIDNGESSVIAPVGFLLADKLRYTAIKDKWVPYIFLVQGEDLFTEVYDLEMTKYPSQHNDPSHFKFKALNRFSITSADELVDKPTFITKENNNMKSSIKKGDCYVCVIGMHWTHTRTSSGVLNPYLLFNFCGDHLRHPLKSARLFAEKHATSWTNCNITSRSLTFTDKGEKNKKWEDVYIAK